MHHFSASVASTCSPFQCMSSGASILPANVFRMLLVLPHSLCISDADLLRIIAKKSSVCASANIPDALQCRGNPISILKTLLYCIRSAQQRNVFAKYIFTLFTVMSRSDAEKRYHRAYKLLCRGGTFSLQLSVPFHEHSIIII